MEFSKKLVGSTTGTLILAVIQEESCHGYEIVQRVDTLSRGAFQWKEGTVYPALHRLEKEGLIVGEWRSVTAGRQRRIYSLTKEGRKELVRQEQEWSVFAKTVNLVLRGCHAT